MRRWVARCKGHLVEFSARGSGFLGLGDNIYSIRVDDRLVYEEKLYTPNFRFYSKDFQRGMAGDLPFEFTIRPEAYLLKDTRFFLEVIQHGFNEEMLRVE
jgi:hypothetical protein